MTTVASTFRSGSNLLYEIGLQLYFDFSTGTKKTITRTNGMRKASKVCCDALALLSQFYESSPLLLLYRQLKNFRDLTKAFRMIDHLKIWLCPETNAGSTQNPFWLNPKTSWLKIISKAFATCSETCSFIKFLNIAHIIEREKCIKFLCTLPFLRYTVLVPLELVKNICDIISCGIAISDNYLSMKKTNEAAFRQNLQEGRWQHRKNLIESVVTKSPGYEKHILELEKFYESKIQTAELKIKKLNLSQKLSENTAKRSAKPRFNFKYNGRRIIEEVNNELLLLMESSQKLAQDALYGEQGYEQAGLKEKINKWREELWLFLDQLDEFQQSAKFLEIDKSFSEIHLQLTKKALELLDGAENNLNKFNKIDPLAVAGNCENENQIRHITDKKNLWRSLKDSSMSLNAENPSGAMQSFCVSRIKNLKEKESKTHWEKALIVVAVAVRVGKIGLALLSLIALFGFGGPFLNTFILTASILTYFVSYIKYLCSPDRKMKMD